MISKEFLIDDLKLNYFVGINQISLNYIEYRELNKLASDNDALESLFSLVSQFNEKYEDITIQFIDDELILSDEHIFRSIYFVQKAFLNEFNISNSKSMEILLYLSSQRQIKKSIKAFGVKIPKLKKGKLTYLIISPINNIDKINQEILQRLNAYGAEITINNLSFDKLKSIKSYFDISDNQIRSIINSYTNIEIKDDIENYDTLKQVIHDILCEKMSILSLEKIKSD